MVDDINDLFVTARDEICDAIEDKDTTYFNEGVESAGKAVDAVMQKWELLLSEVGLQGVCTCSADTDNAIYLRC